MTEANAKGRTVQPGYREHQQEVLIKEFDLESDRAAVILAASLIDNTLREFLQSHLVPTPSARDELFDGPNAPLATFSGKIAIAYRLGLISSRFSRDLHLLRRIRNAFAHNIHGCSFEEGRVKARVAELYSGLNDEMKKMMKRENLGNDTRMHFLLVSSWMTWHLSTEVESSKALESCVLEFGYRRHHGPTEERNA